MKCINKRIKKITAGALLCCLFLLTACGSGKEDSYQIYTTSDQYQLTASTSASDSSSLFAKKLALPTEENSAADEAPDIGTAKAALVIDTNSNQVLYSYNMLSQVFPASTTKVLTALTAVKYGNLDQEVTVGDDVRNIDASSSVAGINPGDVLTLRQLLYGLLLPSGNDAAIAIADAVSGSSEKFVARMNEVAKSLGATKSHFVTVNGLHDDNHYTTPYDMYLIFQEACKNDELVQIMSSPSYNAYYRSASGEAVQKIWTNSMRYLVGAKKAPDGITVIGGKTGTTGNAGHCLVMLSKATNDHQLISIVYGADCNYNLYLDMNEILTAAQNKLTAQN